MQAPPEPPPEGKLIAAAAADAGLSIREAARRADISYGRWRQIVRGYQNVSPGVYAPVRNAPARTIARMAAAAGVTADQLTEAGRLDAADKLRAIQQKESAGRLADSQRDQETPAGTEDEDTVWAEVKRHPWGTPGAMIFPSGIPGEVTEDAQRWDALAPLTSVEDLIRVIAFWRQHPPQDADPGHNGTMRWEAPRASLFNSR